MALRLVLIHRRQLILRVLLRALMLVLEVSSILKASIGDRGHVLIDRLRLFIVTLIFAMIKANRFNFLFHICRGLGCVAANLRASCLYLQVCLISGLFAIFALINL